MNNRIKVAMITNNLVITGIGTVIMNYCKRLDINKFEVTIIAGSPIVDAYRTECESFNIKIEEIPSKKETPLLYYISLFKKINRARYDIVHIHGNSSLMAIELFISKLKRIKYRIAHCHNSSCSNIKAHKLFLPMFRRLYSKGLACSKLAGEWVFGENEFTILPNGFDIKRYKYNVYSRENIRNSMDLQNKFVIGHVGRFNYQKNQDFILDIFERLAENENNIVLMLIGTGADLERITERVEQSKYKDRIILYGEATNVEELYSAMDLFVFPSRYEGFGIVIVEAQISGLPCIVSTAVPDDVCVSDMINFIPIKEENISEWINIILKYQNEPIFRENIYKENKEQFDKFDINNSSKLLEQIYCEKITKRII